MGIPRSAAAVVDDGASGAEDGVHASFREVDTADHVVAGVGDVHRVADDDHRPGLVEAAGVEGAIGETHSASRLYDYQCRRLNIRYRDATAGGRTAFCHSLNNTVIASPRILIPILEIYQNADGSVTVPEALRPYMNGKKSIG